MPKRNMTLLSEIDKNQLDQFIEKNYDRLKKYAKHAAHDNWEAEILLNETVKQLYEGRRRLNFTKHPFTYFQYILKSVAFQLLSNRQESFETGYKTTIIKDIDENGKTFAKTCKTVIRGSFHDNPMEKMVMEGFDTERLDKIKQQVAYQVFKARCTPRRQWILEQLEANKNPDMMHQILAQRGIHIGLLGFRVQVTRVLRLVEQEMEKVHLQADLSGGQGR